MSKLSNNRRPRAAIQTGVITIDLGGTKLRTAIISPEGKIIYRSQTKTEAIKGPEHVIKKIMTSIKVAIEKSSSETRINSIALAIAGALDVNKGLITTSPNLPGWKNVALAGIIEQKFNFKTCLLNDASAAAFGEYFVGAGKGTKNLIFLTISTGIGGGIVINGKLYEGTDGAAGELGHMIIKEGGPKCHCGQNGCLEAMASGYAVVRETNARLEKGEKSSLQQIFRSGKGTISAKDVADAAKTGDRLSCDVIENTIAYNLGIGLANIINIFNPEIIVIGGGLSKMGNMLLRPAARVAKQTALRLPASSTNIVKAKLGDSAGIVGAGLFAGIR
jgi:glucokinase